MWWLKTTTNYYLTVLEVRDPKMGLMGLNRSAELGVFLETSQKLLLAFGGCLRSLACGPSARNHTVQPPLPSHLFFDPDPPALLSRDTVIP
jgi:hypothetical protein